MHHVPPLLVSVDYVDYVHAKNFCQTVEDWFSSLEESPNSRFLAYLSSSGFPWEFSMKSLSALTTAIFIFIFWYISKNDLVDLKSFYYLLSTALAIWMVSSIVNVYISKRIERVVKSSMIPAVVILTKGDERSFVSVKERAGRFVPSLLIYAFGVLSNFGLNVGASFFYAWLRPGQ